MIIPPSYEKYSVRSVHFVSNTNVVASLVSISNVNTFQTSYNEPCRLVVEANHPSSTGITVGSWVVISHCTIKKVSGCLKMFVLLPHIIFYHRCCKQERFISLQLIIIIHCYLYLMVKYNVTISEP